MNKEDLNKLYKAVEYIAQNLVTYGGGSIADRVHEILYPPDPKQFLECDTCRAKPGSPQLCNGCLHNRTLIGKLQKPE